MAIQVIREVNADVVKRGVTKSVYAKQNDFNSRFLNVRIQEDGKDITVNPSLTVILNVERPDHSKNMFYGTVNPDGTVQVPMTSWMLELEGSLVCDISLVSDDPKVAKLTTMLFNIYVEPATITDGEIIDMPEYNVIVDLLKKVEDIPKMVEEEMSLYMSRFVETSYNLFDKYNPGFQKFSLIGTSIYEASNGHAVSLVFKHTVKPGDIFLYNFWKDISGTFDIGSVVVSVLSKYPESTDEILSKVDTFNTEWTQDSHTRGRTVLTTEGKYLMLTFRTNTMDNEVWETELLNQVTDNLVVVCGSEVGDYEDYPYVDRYTWVIDESDLSDDLKNKINNSGSGIQSIQINERGYLQIQCTDGSVYTSTQPIVNYTVTFTVDESGEIFADKTIAECLEIHNKGLSVDARLIGLDTTYEGKLSDIIVYEDDPQLVETVKFLLSAANDATKYVEISTQDVENFAVFNLKNITLSQNSDIPKKLPNPESLVVNGLMYDGSIRVDMTTKILELIYPVGSIYLSMNSFNPKDLFGFGTWTQIKDRFLLSAGDTYTLGKTGGAATHTLTTKELPKQTGTIVTHGKYAGTPIADATGVFSKGSTVSGKYLSGSQGTSADSVDVINYSNGGAGTAHNNMPPYIVVHVWYRIS